MEPDAVAIILMHASKLHEKFDDAIEQARDLNADCNGSGNSDNGFDEVKSLSSMREALEVLEEQLDCLQILQQQQQADKEAALSDLDESRRIFLERLKKHNGREWGVVKDALAFAGESVSEESKANTGSDKDKDAMTIKSLEWSQEMNQKKEEEREKDVVNQRFGVFKTIGKTFSVVGKTAFVGFGLLVLLHLNKRNSRKCKSRSAENGQE